jgi:hypothetical protein
MKRPLRLMYLHGVLSRRVPLTRSLAFVTCGLSFLATGCLHPKIGPNSLPRERSLYSISLADSWKQVTLLNIVKVRYLDPPVYVDIANIVSSYTLAQSATADGVIEPGGMSGATLGASIGLSHSPTITYTPLTGNAYIRSLTTPLAPASVFSAMQNGVPADLILLSSVQSINGLRNEQATMDGIRPADPEFHRVRELLREIQLSGMVRLYVKEDAGKQQTTLLAFRTDHIPPEIQAATAELRRLLRLDPNATDFKVVSAPLPSSDKEVAVITRSIVGILQNMAAEVEVPPQDLAQHRAVPGFAAGHTLPGIVPIIRIHSAKDKPADADAFVGVRYRDTWFWIDDGDLPSKRSFAQLMQLFTMADTGVKENMPIVTIPSR